jgi:sigma-E factor negative regulatory protein RseC
MTGCCDDDVGPGGRELSERLRVIAVESDRLVVAADRISACAACAQAKGCGTKVLMSMSRTDLMTLPRPVGLVVRAGDEVDVSMSGNSLLAGVGLAYLLPAVTFVIALSAAAGAGLSDVASAGLAVAALALSFVPVVLVERHAKLAGAMQVLGVHPSDLR